VYELCLAPRAANAIHRLEIDSDSMILRSRDQEVPITTREFRLLEFLARNTGRVFTRDQLLDAVCRGRESRPSEILFRNSSRL
jgi:DNA-binding response OmpR family regulator